MAKPKFGPFLKRKPAMKGNFCVEQKKGAKKKLAPGSVTFQVFSSRNTFTVTRRGCPVGKFKRGKCHAFPIVTHVARRVKSKGGRCEVGKRGTLPA